MNNSGIEYEKLTQEVFDQIINRQGVSTIDIQHDIVLQGRTTKHQIDVYWKFEIGGIKYHTIIQAKDWKSRVPQKEMLAFSEILSDLPSGTKGIFVTKTGYQDGAIEVAKARGIALYLLRNPSEADWAGHMRNLHFTIHLNFPHRSNLTIVLDNDWIISQNLNISELENGQYYTQATPLFNPAGVQIGSIGDIIKSLENGCGNDNTEEHTKHLVHSFEETAYMAIPDGKLVKVKEISGDFWITTSQQVIEIIGDNVIGWMLIDILSGDRQSFSWEKRLLRDK